MPMVKCKQGLLFWFLVDQPTFFLKTEGKKNKKQKDLDSLKGTQKGIHK